MRKRDYAYSCIWTIYLGILGAVANGFLIKGKYNTAPAKVDFVFSIITWMGLFGYVTNIQIMDRSVWQVFHWIALGLYLRLLFCELW